MRKEKLLNILAVARFVQNNPDTYLREIAKETKLSPSQVYRALQDMGDFIVTRSVNEELQSAIDVPLPKLRTFIRLRQGVTVEGIIRFLGVKEKLQRINKAKSTVL